MRGWRRERVRNSVSILFTTSIMLYTRRPRVQRRKARKQRAYRKRRAARPVSAHVFSETFKSSPLEINQDGTGSSTGAQLLHAQMASIQQYAQYKALYKKWRILKLEWIILPTWAGAEPNQADDNVGIGGPYDTNTWMHYKKAWDTNTNGVPVNELSMLQLNGVRTIGITSQNRKPIRISMRYPTPQVSLDSQGGAALIDVQKNTWCSFDDDMPNRDFGRLYTYGVNRSTGVAGVVGSVYADVYCKITFAVKDPR